MPNAAGGQTNAKTLASPSALGLVLEPLEFEDLRGSVMKQNLKAIGLTLAVAAMALSAAPASMATAAAFRSEAGTVKAHAASAAGVRDNTFAIPGLGTTECSGTFQGTITGTSQADLTVSTGYTNCRGLG